MPLPHDPQRGLPHSLPDLAASADEHLASLLKQLHHVLAIRPEPVLHVFGAVGLVRRATEGVAHFDGADLLPAREFGGVQAVGVWRVAAEEEKGGSEGAASTNLGGAFLDKATERGDSCYTVSVVGRKEGCCVDDLRRCKNLPVPAAIMIMGTFSESLGRWND